MGKAKIPFFKRIGKAITNFESYSDFALENISVAIKYFAILMLIFSLLISIAFTFKFSQVVNNEEELQIMYNQLLDNGLDLSTIDDAIDYVKSNNNAEFYIMLTISVTLYVFCIYFILGFGDVLLISILGFLVTKITRVPIKYKPIFIMSIYALTLPIILNCIYIVANTLTGFTIEYFSIVYNVIAYIYIITAILMIKSDFIDQQRELIKIVEEQKKISEEQNEKNDSEDSDKPEEKPEDEKKKEEPPTNEEPNSEPTQ